MPDLSHDGGPQLDVLRRPLRQHDNAVYDQRGRLLFGVNTSTLELAESLAITGAIVRAVNATGAPAADSAGLLALVIRLHREGTLSEGQVAKASGLDRVEIRRLADEQEEATHG